MTRPIIVALTASLALAACGGGGSGASSTPSVPSAPQQTAHGSATATITLKIPNANSTTSGVRRAQFIGAAVAGVALQFYFHTDTGHVTPIGSGAFDVSSTSGLCTPAVGVRSCSLQQTTQTGAEDLVVTTYDAPPVSGSFAAAHQLGTGTIYNVTLTAAGPNNLAVAVGGTVATMALSPAVVQLPAGSAVTFPLTYTAYDKAGEMIVAGSNTVTNGGTPETDTYSNPITLSVSELGGSGHVLLSTGGAPAASVQLLASNTPVTVSYDGNGATGYSASLAAIATGATSSYAAIAFEFGAGIFVANPNTASILTYPYISSLCTTANPCTLNEAPLANIATTPDPTAVALDSSGRIYVTNYSPGQQVSVYASNANGSAPSIETIFIFGGEPQFIALDSLGRFYVDVYSGGYIRAFPPVSPACLPSSPCVSPTPLATYSAISPPPYYGPYGIAIDSSNRLYANDIVNDAFSVFAALPGSCLPASPCSVSYTSSVITSTLGINGFEALDPSGRLYLTTPSATNVYAPLPANCSTGTPCTLSQVATITGSLGFIAIDANGTIYSSSGATNSITVYPPLSSSCSAVSPCSVTAAPIATISGSNTLLSGNQGIAVP